MTASFDIPKQIEAMTKKELIMLLRRTALGIKEHDVRMVMYQHLGRQANKMALEALSEMRFLDGAKNHHAYERAQAKFDKAMRLYDKASAILQMV